MWRTGVRYRRSTHDERRQCLMNLLADATSGPALMPRPRRRRQGPLRASAALRFSLGHRPSPDAGNSVRGEGQVMGATLRCRPPRWGRQRGGRPCATSSSTPNCSAWRTPGSSTTSSSRSPSAGSRSFSPITRRDAGPVLSAGPSSPSTTTQRSVGGATSTPAASRPSWSPAHPE